MESITHMCSTYIMTATWKCFPHCWSFVRVIHRPHKGSVMWRVCAFVVTLKKILDRQSSFCRWFETLWRSCDVIGIIPRGRGCPCDVIAIIPRGGGGGGGGGGGSRTHIITMVNNRKSNYEYLKHLIARSVNSPLKGRFCRKWIHAMTSSEIFRFGRFHLKQSNYKNLILQKL